MKPRLNKKTRVPPQPRDTCMLTLSGRGFTIHAEWRKKDAEIFIKAFTAQAMRQAS